MLRGSLEKADATKRELHFPPCQGNKFVMGSEGVYVGMQDYWIETVDAKIELELAPGSAGRPRCLLRVAAPSDRKDASGALAATGGAGLAGGAGGDPEQDDDDEGDDAGGGKDTGTYYIAVCRRRSSKYGDARVWGF